MITLKKKKNCRNGMIIIILIFTIFFSSLFLIINIQVQSFNKNNHILFESNLKTASNGQALPYTSIYQNSTYALRLFNSIYFEINTSVFVDTNYSILQLHFLNDEFKNYTMKHETGANFSYTYTPEYDAPLGFCNASFFIFNVINVQLNSHTTFVNFTIDSNYITYIEYPEYSRNDTVYGELEIDDAFTWNLTIVDNTNESLQQNLFNIGNNMNYFSFKINNSFTVYDKYYYVKVNMTEVSPPNKKAAAYLPFMVLNTLPEIVISSINFSKQEIKRAEEFIISLNVTDNDLETFPENITVRMLLTDSKGQSLPVISLTNNNDWSFSNTLSIDIDRSIGIYQVTFEAEDQYNGIGTYSTFITVKNNFPEIHGFTINGLSLNQSISINYGEDIVFEFNISDVEDTIAYVTVGLFNENDNWYNITMPYHSDMELTIRTEELISGIWMVYLSVTDVDGDTTYITDNYGLGPKEIRIIPDLIEPILSWITLLIGLIFGILIGIGLIYGRYKSKLTEFKKPTKKKEKSIKKAVEVKKEKERKVEMESVEDAEIISEEEAKKPPQRKIRRKLS